MNYKLTEELQVLKSNAGFYIGTLYYDEEWDCYFPNSRETHYFATQEEAENYFEQMQKISWCQ